MSLVNIYRADLPEATIGQLFIDGEFCCFTLERPWRDNKRNVSCVPEGEYDMAPYISQRHGKTWALVSWCCFANSAHTLAHQRWGILFHPANNVAELQGCVAPGTRCFLEKDTATVLGSRHAMNLLRSRLTPTEHTLQIGRIGA